MLGEARAGEGSLVCSASSADLVTLPSVIAAMVRHNTAMVQAAVILHQWQGEYPSALTQTEGSGSLLSLPMMTLAGLVQTNGLGSPLCSRM